MPFDNTSPQDNKPEDRASKNPLRIIWKLLGILGSTILFIPLALTKLIFQTKEQDSSKTDKRIRSLEEFSARHGCFEGIGLALLVAIFTFIGANVLSNNTSPTQTPEPALITETATEQVISTDEPNIELVTNEPPPPTLMLENMNTDGSTPTNTATPITNTPDAITQLSSSASAEDNLQLLITQNYFVIYVISETSLEGLQLSVINDDFERPIRTIVDDVPRLNLTNNIAQVGFCIMYTYVQNPSVGVPNQCTGQIERVPPLSANEVFWWIPNLGIQLQVAVYREGEFADIICDIINSGGACSFNY